MAVRRIAKEQPASFAFSPETKAKADWWIAKYPEGRQQSAIIPLLWLIQKQEGWVSEPAMRAAADLLAMAYIRVYEVATFYTMFHLEPMGRHHLQVCGTTPCMLRGANEIKDVCRRTIGEPHHPTADGLLSWEEVECLGACANAPVLALYDYYHEDLTGEDVESLIATLKSGAAPPKPGSYRGRQTSAPEGAETSLTDPTLYDGSLGKPLSALPNAPKPA